MVIDFHTHVFPDKIAKLTVEKLQELSNNTPYTDGSESGMREALKRAKADIAVALPVLTKPTQFESVLRFALEVNSRFNFNTSLWIDLYELYEVDIVIT